MNMEFYSKFNYKEAPLPLKPYKNIIHGNATRIDWNEICPQKNEDDIIFVLGNPPYLGSKSNQKNKKKIWSMYSKG